MPRTFEDRQQADGSWYGNVGQAADREVEAILGEHGELIRSAPIGGPSA